MKKTEPLGTVGHKEGPVQKEKAKVEIPVHKVEETPSPVPEAKPSPAIVEAPETDPIMEELLKQKQRLFEEIEQQKRSYEEEIKKQKEILERQWAEIIEKERKRKEQQELEKREKERLSKQEEMKAEIQKLKLAKEETQKKAQQELDAVRRARDKSAFQVEEKVRVEPQKAPITRVMNAIPLNTVLPTTSSHAREVSFPGMAEAEKIWNDIVTKYGSKPKKQTSSAERGKVPRGYTKQMVQDWANRKKAEEKEKLAAQVPPPPVSEPR